MSERQTVYEWCVQNGVVILDPDGWREKCKEFDLWERMTTGEFHALMMPSTCKFFNVQKEAAKIATLTAENATLRKALEAAIPYLEDANERNRIADWSTLADARTALKERP